MNITTLRVVAILDNLPQISEFIKTFFREQGFDEEFCRQTDIAVEEIYVNIASYAYQKGDKGYAKIECEAYEDRGVLIFKDGGIPYDPLEAEDPETEDPDGMTIGGYGIFMAKSIMDEVRYRYDESKRENILTMMKKKREEANENQKP